MKIKSDRATDLTATGLNRNRVAKVKTLPGKTKRWSGRVAILIVELQFQFLNFYTGERFSCRFGVVRHAPPEFSTFSGYRERIGDVRVLHI